MASTLVAVALEKESLISKFSFILCGHLICLSGAAERVQQGLGRVHPVTGVSDMSGGRVDLGGVGKVSSSISPKNYLQTLPVACAGLH